MDMAAAAVSAEQTGAGKGSRKLWILLGVVVVLALGAVGGYLYLQQRKAAAAEAEDGAEATQMAPVRKAPKRDAHMPPTYMPLETFVVNLADRDSDRYAQIGITLEFEDAKVADELKAFMPAVRNGILMILSHKTAADMLGREGKEQLAAEIAREVVRPLGIHIDAEPEAPASAARKKRTHPVYNPVQQVHFSSFIVQ
jgi:flagellar FliL protein